MEGGELAVQRPLLVKEKLGHYHNNGQGNSNTYNHDVLSLSPPVSFVVVLSAFAVYSCSYANGNSTFPTNIKGPARTLINVASWVGNRAVSYSFNLKFEWDSAVTFFLFGGICFACFVFVWKLVPETKGRTLEEIQASISQ